MKFNFPYWVEIVISTESIENVFRKLIIKIWGFFFLHQEKKIKESIQAVYNVAEAYEHKVSQKTAVCSVIQEPYMSPSEKECFI